LVFFLGARYTTVFQKENSIDLLLVEAQRLEKKAGQGKNALEKAKSHAGNMHMKWKKLRKELLFSREHSGSHGALYTQGQVVKVVTYQNNLEDALLKKVEAETAFRTVLQAYESRMPKIVNTIRNDNIQRIRQWKQSMRSYIAIKKKKLAVELEHLSKLEASVEGINTTKDMEAFAQGTSDFWQGGENKRPAGEAERRFSNTAVSRLVTTKPPPSILSAIFRLTFF
jgi:hypothetical protein